MAITGPVGVNQLLSYPFIAGRISRLGVVGSVMSSFYGVNLRTEGKGKQAKVVTGARRRSAKRDIVYDVMDNSRLTLPFSSPGAEANRVERAPIATQTVRGLRMYNALPFRYEDLRDFRVMGSANPSVVDPMAASYIGLQMDRLIQRSMNTREFMFTRMLKGSVQLSMHNNAWYPVLSGGQVTVDYRLPAGHRTQLAIGGTNGSTNIISASWANPATDVPAQLHELRSVAARVSGIEPRKIWMNSVLFGLLQNNTVLQRVGGTAFKVFETFSRREVSPSSVADVNGSWSTPHYYYQFRGMPQMDIHVYDGGITLPSPTDPQVDSTTANWTKFIGDTEVIITPDPSFTDWFDLYDITEVIQEQAETGPVEVSGFHAWSRRIMQGTAGEELHLLDNFAYAMPIPNAIFNPTVVF
jgi:Phage major capsid protein E